MMDASAVGPGAGPDVTSSSRTSPKGEGTESGFQDALASRASDGQGAGKGSNGEQQSTAGAPSEQELSLAQRLKHARWLQEHSLSAQTQSKDKSETGKNVIGGKTGHANDPEKDAKAGAAKKGTEAMVDDIAATGSQDAKGVTGAEEADDPIASDGAKDGGGGKPSGKGDAALGDVLTLLSGAEGSAAAQSRAAGGSGKDGDAGATDRRARAADPNAPLPGAEDAAVANTGQNDADMARTFRFVRADGRGQTMQMAISGRQGDLRDVATRVGGLDQADTVTVIDARRFLGLAPDSNSSAVVKGLSGDPEWSAAMQPSSALSNAATLSSTGKVVNTLKIQMHPIELGLVTATMRLKGDELSVELTVETHAAYRQLSEDQRKIVEALKAQGFAVDQVSISVSNADRGDPAGNQAGTQGQTGGQQASQGGDGGNRSSGRGEAEGQQERNRGLVTDGTATEKQSGQVSGTGSARPGHVYL